jgi:hypothetical protein
MSAYHAVSVATGGVHRYVIWIEGHDGPDRLAVDGGRIVSWSGMENLRQYAARRRWVLAGDEAPEVVDLDRAAAWVRGSGSLDPELLLRAWNLCWDVARSVDTTFDDRRQQRDHVYDKLFWATSVSVTSPPGEPPERQWSAEELQVLRDVLSEGITLAQAALAARE